MIKSCYARSFIRKMYIKSCYGKFFGTNKNIMLCKIMLWVYHVRRGNMRTWCKILLATLFFKDTRISHPYLKTFKTGNKIRDAHSTRLTKKNP